VEAEVDGQKRWHVQSNATVLENRRHTKLSGNMASKKKRKKLLPKAGAAEKASLALSSLVIELL
jgi:hypothetical protein